MILVYHRVADSAVDPWVLGVSPANFAQQLEVLKAVANPISLQQLVNAKSDADLPPRPVCITFDDGYADNLYAAKPALEQFHVPATVFITPGYLGIPEDLWWDEVAKLVLDPATRLRKVGFTAAGREYSFEFPASPEDGSGVDPNAKWRAWDPCPGPRQAAYMAIYEVLVKLPDAERERAMEQLRQGATYTDRRQNRCLTEDEVRELAAGELVEIGAHTLTHPVLSQLAPDQQQQEIAGSQRRLEAMVGRKVTSFAYPYGKKMHYNNHTVRTVRANGFSCACSNFGGLVTRTSDRYALPRFQPLNWNGEEFADVVLNGWYKD
jgi:peptidoglycan/xylan/chitin deacetylase (PgdA/CDA1 family)